MSCAHHKIKRLFPSIHSLNNVNINNNNKNNNNNNSNNFNNNSIQTVIAKYLPDSMGLEILADI